MAALTAEELDALAAARLADAATLFTAGRYDGARYVCGYAIELKLKARICRAHGWAAYPPTSELNATLKTHNLKVLLLLSTLHATIVTDYRAFWGVVALWNPELRYDLTPTPAQVAHDMIEATRLAGDFMIDPKHILAIRDRIIADRGWLMLLALSEREASPGDWDLLIAGGGLGWGGLDDYKYIADLMKQELTPAENLSIYTFVLIRETNEWLQQLVERVHVENGEPVELRDVEFGDVQVRRALIFHAQPAEVGAARA